MANQNGLVRGDGDPEVDMDHPCAEAGHRMPHAWLEDGSAWSTLDLLSSTRFTLFWPGTGHDLIHDDRIQPISMARESVPAEWLELAGLAWESAMLVPPAGPVARREPPSMSQNALDDFLLELVVRGRQMRPRMRGVQA